MSQFTLLQKVVPIGLSAGGMSLRDIQENHPYYYAFYLTYGYFFITGFIGDKIKISINPEAGAKGLHYYPAQLTPWLVQQEKME